MTTEGDDLPAGPPPARPPARRLVLFLVLLAAAVMLVIAAGRQLTPASMLLHYDTLRAAVEAHPALTMLGYVVTYAAVTALSIPGALVMTVIGGLLFGWLTGGAAAAAASTAGGSVLFLVARTTAGRYLSAQAGPRLQSILAGLRADALNYLLFLRLVPVFPFWLVNIAAGVVGMRFHQFLAATLIGVIPATLALASAGAALDGVVIAQKAAFDACRAAGGAACAFDLSLSTLLTPGVLTSLAALGVLALVPVLVRRWRGGFARALPSTDNRP